MRYFAFCAPVIVLAALVMTSCALSQSQSYDAYVTHTKDDAPAGLHYPSVSAALAQAPADNSLYRIWLGPGQHSEKLQIHRDNVEITGAGTEQTRLSYDDYAGKVPEGGSKGMGTTGSASITVFGKNITFKHLTLANDFDFLANEALGKVHSDYVGSGQAVAIKLAAGSDRVAFVDVNLRGYQDTLYVDGERAVFIKSKIYGNVDFIFGSGNALFYQSDIISLGRAKPVDVYGFITAPSTDINRSFGLTFIDCRLLHDKGVPAESYYLGRPWHPTKTFADGRYADPDAVGKTVFYNTFMDNHIHPEGWTSMSGTPKGGGPKTVFTPAMSRFFEYHTFGPGANKNDARPQLTKTEAAEYTLENILGDWAETVKAMIPE